MSGSAMGKSPDPHYGGWKIFISDANRMLVKETIGQAQTYYHAVTYIPAIKWLNPETRLQLFLYLPISRKIGLLENMIMDLSGQLGESGGQVSVPKSSGGFKRIPSFTVRRCVVWPFHLFCYQTSKDFLTYLIDCGVEVSIFPFECLNRLKESVSATAYENMNARREFFVIDVPSGQSDPLPSACWGDGVNIWVGNRSESGHYADIFEVFWKEGLKLENDQMVSKVEIYLTKLMRSWGYC